MDDLHDMGDPDEEQKTAKAVVEQAPLESIEQNKSDKERFEASIVSVATIVGSMVYNIETISGNSVLHVKRKFDDFEWLHNTFLKNADMTAVMLPYLPGKETWDSERVKKAQLSDSGLESRPNEEQLFSKRVKQLQRYLNNCLLHPKISADSNLLAFLTKETLSIPEVSAISVAAPLFADLFRSTPDPKLDPQPIFGQVLVHKTNYSKQLDVCVQVLQQKMAAQKALASSLASFFSTCSMADKNMAIDKDLFSLTELVSKGGARVVENDRQCAQTDISDRLLSYLLTSKGHAEATLNLLNRRLHLLQVSSNANKKYLKAKKENESPKGRTPEKIAAVEISMDEDAKAKAAFEDASIAIRHELGQASSVHVRESRLALLQYAEDKISHALGTHDVYAGSLAALTGLISNSVDF